MNRKDQGAKIFAVIFLTVLFGFSFGNLLENGRAIWREIQKIHWENPQKDLRKVETEMSEKLLLRNPMLEAYGVMQAAMGKRELNGLDVVKDQQGFLYDSGFWNEFGDDEQELALRTKRLQMQLEQQGIKFGVVTFPMNLPQKENAYWDIPYEDLTARANRFCGWLRRYDIPLLDLQKDWQEAGLHQQEAFFRTDHHWSPLAAFHGYTRLLHWMVQTYHADIPNLETLCSLDFYEQVTKEKQMVGSQGRKAGLVYAGGPEDYTAIYPKAQGDYLLREGTAEKYKQHEGGFSEALMRLEYDLDSYEDYFDGEAERTYLYASIGEYASIQNRQTASREKVLLLRDSYATPVGAFLAQSFSQVDMLWIRKYSPEELETWLEENSYDYVFLMLYPKNLSLKFFPFGMEETGNEPKA